jgi:5-methylcytosine-specific restriction endonuclease McrA
MITTQEIHNNQRKIYEDLVSRKLAGEFLPTPLFRKLWNSYLQQPEWIEKREAVEKRCKGICERCYSAPMADTHHITYKRRFVEKLEDLQGLCRNCHDLTHNKLTKKPETVKNNILTNTGDNNMTLTVYATSDLLFVKVLKKFAKLNEFDARNYTSDLEYEASEFSSIARWTGLIHRTIEESYAIHNRLKELAACTDEQIIAFVRYFKNNLCRVEKSRLDKNNILLKDKIHGKLGKIRYKFRQYHPDFNNIFVNIGLKPIDILKDIDKTDEIMKIVATMPSVAKVSAVTPEPVSVPVVNTTVRTKLNQNKIQRAIMVTKIKNGGNGFENNMSTEEALKVIQTMDELETMGV